MPRAGVDRDGGARAGELVAAQPADGDARACRSTAGSRSSSAPGRPRARGRTGRARRASTQRWPSKSSRFSSFQYCGAGRLDPQHLAPLALPLDRPVGVVPVEAHRRRRAEALGERAVVEPRRVAVGGHAQRQRAGEREPAEHRDADARPQRQPLEPQEADGERGDRAAEHERARRSDRGDRRRDEHEQRSEREEREAEARRRAATLTSSAATVTSSAPPRRSVTSGHGSAPP